MRLTVTLEPPAQRKNIRAAALTSASVQQLSQRAAMQRMLVKRNATQRAMTQINSQNVYSKKDNSNANIQMRKILNKSNDFKQRGGIEEGLAHQELMCLSANRATTASKQRRQKALLLREECSASAKLEKLMAIYHKQVIALSNQQPRKQQGRE